MSGIFADLIARTHAEVQERRRSLGLPPWDFAKRAPQSEARIMEAIMQENGEKVMEKTSAGLVERGVCKACGGARHFADCTGYCRNCKLNMGLIPGARSAVLCACGCGQALGKKAAAVGWLYIRGHKASPVKPTAAPVVQKVCAPVLPAVTTAALNDAKPLYADMLKIVRAEIGDVRKKLEKADSLRERLALLVNTESALAPLAEDMAQ